MQYAILRHGKIKAPLMGAAIAHNYRTSKLEKCNIDSKLTPLNVTLKLDGTPHERLANKLKTLPQKVRKDAVVCMELVLSMSPEWFDALSTDRGTLRGHPKLMEWANASIAWTRKEFGQNVIDIALHMDESSPHMHVLVVPLTKDGRLCAKEVMARAELTRRQDDYAKAMQPFGVSRGIPAKETKRRHIRLTEDSVDGSGRRATDLAKQLALANEEIQRLNMRLERSQNVCIEFSDKLLALEKQLEELKKENKALLNKQQELQEAAALDAELDAMAEFVSKHEKHWPWASSDLQVSVGVIKESAGRFALLHVGQGQHVLHEFDSREQLLEHQQYTERQRLSRGFGLGR